jgi:hypothetical protein
MAVGFDPEIYYFKEMNDYDKIFRKLRKRYTDEEIAEAFVFPGPTQTEAEKAAFNAFLKDYRAEIRRQRGFIENVRHWLFYRVYLRWKFKIQDILK